MPDKIVEYKCRICSRRYGDWQTAMECEQKGYMQTYPIGTIYGDHTDKAMYTNITFAVAANHGYVGNPHLNDGSSWACRDNGAGDCLGENMCGGGFLHLNEYHGRVDTLAPHFQRMVKWLRANGHQVYVWDGEKPVEYNEALPK